MAVYGPRKVGSFGNSDPVFFHGVAGGTFAIGDFVMQEGTSGQIVVCTAGSSILGIARSVGVDGSACTVDVTPMMLVVMDNDLDTQTSIDATDCLEFANFIGGTGAMVVDTNTHSATKAQLLLLKNNPQGYGVDSDTSMGLYLVVERAMSEQAAA